MPMYNLLEYSDNFSMTSGSLWNYYRDEENDSANKTDDNDNIINNNKTTSSKYFKQKTKIAGSSSGNNGRLNAEVVVPLKYFNNFWRSLDLPLINCEIEPGLKWSKYCVLSEVSRKFREVDANVAPVVRKVATTTTTRATFQINNLNFMFQLLLCLLMITYF